MNTMEHLDRAAETVLRISRDLEESGESVARRNLATAVYNELVDLQHPDEELFADDIETRLSALDETIYAARHDFPHLAEALANAIHKLTVHAAFVNAYGQEHDK